MANQQYEKDRIAVERKRGGSMWWMWLIGAVLLVLLAVLLVPLFNDRDSAGADNGTTISEITDAPNNYVGNTVTVSGEVNRIVGPRAFTIGGDDFIGGDELLVVSANAMPAIADRTTDNALVENDLIQVTGPVRMFDLAAFEKEIGFDLDNSLFGEYAGKPAVVAQSVDLTPRAGAAPGGAPVLADANVTVADITGEVDTYLGKNVIVRGEVEEVIGLNSFSIDEDALLGGGIDNDLLVISAQEGLPIINEELGDANVQVQGTVAKFVLADVERDLGYDLDDNLYVDWADRPVIIASNIQAARGPIASYEPAAPVEPGAPAAQPVTEFANITIADITGDPAAYLGQTVAVAGEVEEVIGPNAFSLDEDALLDGGIDNDLLVVSAIPELPLLKTEGIEDKRLMVVGPVRNFERAAFEKEFGTDLDDALFERYEGRPAIVATAVGITAEAAAAATAAPGAGGPAGQLTQATVADIVGDPAAFADRPVVVDGKVMTVLGPSAFTIDEETAVDGSVDNGLLVISPIKDLPDLTNEGIKGNRALVAGPVRMFDLPAFEKEFGVDLDDALFAPYAGRPAIIGMAMRIAPTTDAEAPREAPTAGADANTQAPGHAPTAGADASAQAPGAPLTDMLVVVDAANPESLAGRPATFADVMVQSVPGDKTFWVGPNKEKQLFVVLEEDPSAGPVEGQVDVNEGQTVTVIGEIRRLPSMAEARAQWGLSETNSAELENQQLYLSARKVNIAGQ